MRAGHVQLLKFNVLSVFRDLPNPGNRMTDGAICIMCIAGGGPTLLSSRPWASEIAVVAMVCVVSIFFTPLAEGPYSAVHGPVTALRSLRNKLWLVFSMYLASLPVLAAHLRVLAGGPSSASRMLPAPAVPSELSAVLRC